MIRAAIIGGAGLSGLELIRILAHHPHVELGVVTSTRYAGRRVAETFPEVGKVPHVFQANDAPLDGCELAFLAIPNKASLEWAPRLLRRGLKVIDLSGVFRLPNAEVFKKFYGLEHTAPDLLGKAVFGLPEAFRELIPGAELIANPGCYPTGALLGLLPLGELAAQLSVPPVIDAKSGVSGAGGRVEDDSANFIGVNENFKAYKVFSHQHAPEIDHYLTQCTPYRTAEQGACVFVPHLLPISRGILSTIVLRFSKPVPAGEMRDRYQEFCRREPFVTLLGDGQDAELRMVQYRNECVISLHHDAACETWIVVTVIDNLLKGASGQAVQNMNLMYGWEETSGLV